MMVSPAHLNMREQFMLKHGGIEVSVVHGNWRLFPDGAMMEQSSYGLLREPTEAEVPSLRVKYHEIRLKKATRDFDEYKQQLRCKAKEAEKYANANAPPPPPTDDEIARLQALADVAKEYQANLNEARAALNPGNAGAQQAETPRPPVDSRLNAIEGIKV